GKVRALVAMSTKRFPDLPDVPTMAESGLPERTMTVWNGVVAPAGTPAPMVTRAHAAVKHGLAPGGVKAAPAQMGSEPLVGTPQEFGTFIAAEAVKWAEIVKLAGVKVD